VVVAMLTAGVFLLAYGLNGIKMTKFSSPVGGLGTDPLEVNVPEEPESASGASAPQLFTAPSESTSDAVHTLEVLVSPMMAADLRPEVMPGPPFPIGEREVRPGQQITLDPSGFANSVGIFYFSHDVMLCFAALLCGAPRKMIFHTARQAKNHLAQIGFAATPLVGQLEQIMSECDPRIENDILMNHRYELAAEIFRLARIVGSIIEQTAPKFEAGR